jgi:hypothetical protein
MRIAIERDSCVEAEVSPSKAISSHEASESVETYDRCCACPGAQGAQVDICAKDDVWVIDKFAPHAAVNRQCLLVRIAFDGECCGADIICERRRGPQD